MSKENLWCLGLAHHVNSQQIGEFDRSNEPDRKATAERNKKEIERVMMENCGYRISDIGGGQRRENGYGGETEKNIPETP